MIKEVTVTIGSALKPDPIHIHAGDIVVWANATAGPNRQFRHGPVFHNRRHSAQRKLSTDHRSRHDHLHSYARQLTWRSQSGARGGRPST